jgi:hypothetical protein
MHIIEHQYMYMRFTMTTDEKCLWIMVYALFGIIILLTVALHVEKNSCRTFSKFNTSTTSQED